MEYLRSYIANITTMDPISNLPSTSGSHPSAWSCTSEARSSNHILRGALTVSGVHETTGSQPMAATGSREKKSRLTQFPTHVKKALGIGPGRSRTADKKRAVASNNIELQKRRSTPVLPACHKTSRELSIDRVTRGVACRNAISNPQLFRDEKFLETLEMIAVEQHSLKHVLANGSCISAADGLQIISNKSQQALELKVVEALGLEHVRRTGSCISTTQALGIISEKAQLALELRVVETLGLAHVRESRSCITSANQLGIHSAQARRKLESLVVDEIGLEHVQRGETCVAICNTLGIRSTQARHALELLALEERSSSRLQETPDCSQVARQLGIRSDRAMQELERRTLIIFGAAERVAKGESCASVVRLFQLEQCNTARTVLEYIDVKRKAGELAREGVSCIKIATQRGITDPFLRVTLEAIAVAGSAGMRVAAGELWDKVAQEHGIREREWLNKLERISVNGPAKTRILNGEHCSSVRQAFHIRDDYLYYRLQRIAVFDPARIRVQNGEPCDLVAREHGIEDKDLQRILEQLVTSNVGIAAATADRKRNAAPEQH